MKAQGAVTRMDVVPLVVDKSRISTSVKPAIEAAFTGAVLFFEAPLNPIVSHTGSVLGASVGTLVGESVGEFVGPFVGEAVEVPVGEAE